MNLVKKIKKLFDFIGSEKYKKLAKQDQELLKDQYASMLIYIDFLNQRIDNF